MASTWTEPGRVNAHTHIYSALAPFGMPAPAEPPANFPEILERVWWRLDRAIDADTLRASARLAAAEALLAGTTTLIDHHESPGFIEGSLDVIADACEEIGVRAVVCFGATERNSGREEADRGLDECVRFIRSNRRPLIRGLIGLHASFTVSDETIRRAAARCRELGTVMHVHLAEDLCDVTDAKDRGHDGPLERLLDLEALPPGSIVAHGVHLDAKQIARLDAAGVWIVQNPRSNHGNGVGYPSALSASGHVALGTDGYRPDMSEEAAALEQHARAHGERDDAVARRPPAGRELAAERFADGANGPDLDEVVFAPTAPGDDASPLGVRRGRARSVRVGGRSVVADGQLTGADEAEVRRDAETVAPALWRRMAKVGPTSNLHLHR